MKQNTKKKKTENIQCGKKCCHLAVYDGMNENIF